MIFVLCVIYHQTLLHDPAGSTGAFHYPALLPAGIPPRLLSGYQQAEPCPGASPLLIPPFKRQIFLCIMTISYHCCPVNSARSYTTGYGADIKTVNGTAVISYSSYSAQAIGRYDLSTSHLEFIIACISNPLNLHAIRQQKGHTITTHLFQPAKKCLIFNHPPLYCL